jgi:hypothetical protein
MRRRLALAMFFGMLATGAMAAPPSPGALKSDGVTGNTIESVRWGGGRGWGGGFRGGGWGFRGGGWGGRGWGGRGWGGRGWGWGPAVGVGIGLGLAAGYPYYGGGYYGYGGYGPGPYGCWRTVRVGTPYGWRWRRLWVC